MKIIHGRANYNRIADKVSSIYERKYRRMGTYMQIIPLDKQRFRITRNNDVVDFIIDFINEIVIPLHVTNIINDEDYDTFITGTKIQNRRLMIEADERLYIITRDVDFWYPVK